MAYSYTWVHYNTVPENIIHKKYGFDSHAVLHEFIQVKQVEHAMCHPNV